MKSIICPISSNYNGISFIYVILAYISSVLSSPPCGLYGAPPCQFVPAPPGQTPACARPGKTYCEHVDNYPTYLIKHLVHKWGYEAKNLLVDETWDDFAAVAWHDTPVFYDPAYIFPPPRHNGYGSGGRGYGPHGQDFSGYNYETPVTSSPNTAATHNTQSTELPTFLLYSSAGQRLNLNKNRVTPNNPTLWLKRFVRDLSAEPLSHLANNRTATEVDQLEMKTHTPPQQEGKAAPSTPTEDNRNVSLNMDLLEIVGVDSKENARPRTKRQTSGGSSLCQTTSQFVIPKAALNSKGNWMFVVNEANTASQMVKAELCASNTCSNLCQLPNGYSSRCEQKFVQKRLIALQANGQNLYTDTFWFPSCCVCTISSN